MSRNPAWNMNRKGVSKKEDRWFSKAIRLRDRWTCRNCNSRFPEGEGLDCMHIHSRSNLSTRWDPDNAISGCRVCHGYFTSNPIEWFVWLENEVGRDHIDALLIKKNLTVSAPDHIRQDISDHYRLECRRMLKSDTNDLKAYNNEQE